MEYHLSKKHVSNSIFDHQWKSDSDYLVGSHESFYDQLRNYNEYTKWSPINFISLLGAIVLLYPVCKIKLEILKSQFVIDF